MPPPDEFLNLKNFEHRSLWKKGEPVWSALCVLKDYLEQETFRIEVEIPSGVYLENAQQISIGKGTVLEPGTLIQGPCIIGENCSIRHGAYLRGGVILGNRCTVGHATEVKHSVLLDDATAAHLCYVGDSILGCRVNLGAGVKCANFRLDGKKISIFYEGQKIATGLRKFGAVIGDNGQIGCNSVLNPGTLFGRDSFCHPLVNVGGFVPATSEVKQKIPSKGGSILERILEKSSR